MIHFSEPNTNKSQIETGVEGVEQEEDFSSAYFESSVGDQHYVCVVNPERVRGFPVEINLEEGENDAGGEDSDDPNQRNVPELEGNLLYQHECKGHWPHDKGCDACVQARGRTPARRRKQKSEESGQTAEFQLAADYTFIAGRHWRLLVMLMIHTGMLGIVVVTGNKENDVKSVASVLNEIGVGGLIEVATDNERYLIDLMSKGLATSNARAYHWRNISEYRPQAKGVELRLIGFKAKWSSILMRTGVLRFCTTETRWSPPSATLSGSPNQMVRYSPRALHPVQA